MTIEQNKTFESVMDRLRANYLAGLNAKADLLADALTRVRAGDDAAGASVAEQIHRLAGTAGSFGVHDVSDVANALDVRLHNGEQALALTREIEDFIQLLRTHFAPADEHNPR